MGTQMMKEPYHRKRFISTVRFGNPFRHFVALLHLCCPFWQASLHLPLVDTCWAKKARKDGCALRFLEVNLAGQKGPYQGSHATQCYNLPNRLYQPLFPYGDFPKGTACCYTVL